MKKIILLVAVCFVFASIQAQNYKAEKPHLITIVAGWNYSKYQVEEDGPPTGNYKSGGIFGVNRDIKLSSFVWTNAGILFYQNGADTRDGIFQLNYLMLPAGVKLRFGPAYAMGGFYGAYRLTATLDGDKLEQDDYNRFDFGSYVGAGMRLSLFSLNVKYSWGLSDVTNGSNNAPDFNLTNEFLSVTLGVGIP
ncbi:MAG: porin family protein [Vicingaceae bacterium]